MHPHTVGIEKNKARNCIYVVCQHLRGPDVWLQSVDSSHRPPAVFRLKEVHEATNTNEQRIQPYISSNKKFDGEEKIGEEGLALTRLGAREAHKLQEGDRNANMTGLLRANFSARDLGDSYSNFA